MRTDSHPTDENSLSFALISGYFVLNFHQFRRHSGGVRKDFTEKGVIEIIFDVQTSQL